MTWSREEPPREVDKNRWWRYGMERSLGNPKRQQWVLEKCKHDPIFWINAFVWQYNTMALSEHAYSREAGPFVTWGFQDRAVGTIRECIKERKDLLILKSREMGASWLCLLVQLHGMLFWPWHDYLTISHNEDAVDRTDDPSCLFFKLDFVINRLPHWMIEGRLKWPRSGMIYTNKKLHSSITGQASTSRSGIGGRARAMFIDEYSAIKEDYGVLHYTANTTGCRIFNGTHRGLGTAFFELSQRVDIRKLVMHWSEHPDKRVGLYRFDDSKNQIEHIDKAYSFPHDYQFKMEPLPAGGPFPGLRSPWYDEMVPRQGSMTAVAMNLDIDPKGSTSQFFDPLLIHTLKKDYCCEPVWEGDLKFDQDTGRPYGLVRRKGGLLKLWIHPTHDGKVAPDLYGIGGDLSLGSGATNTCFSVMRSTGDKVAEYADNWLRPEIAAPFAVALCWLFKSHDNQGAKLCWELQGPGVGFRDRVVNDLGYRNIYLRRDEDRISKTTDFDRAGWVPNVKNNKRTTLEEYRDALVTRKCINRSEIALTECLDFEYTVKMGVEHGGALAAEDPTKATDNHGDRVIADALAWKMVKSFGRMPEEKREERLPLMSLGWRRKWLAESEKDVWE